MSDEPRDKSVFERYALSQLPPYAKLFVALFVSLMLCVVLWATWIFYQSEGVVNPKSLPAYLRGSADSVNVRELPGEVRQDLNEIISDSSAVLAPQWDTEHAGKEQPLDSAAIVRIAKNAARDTIEEYAGDGDFEPIARTEGRFRRNLGLAHTHVNGQTLLFFAMGALFLFSSAKPRIKRTLYWIFGSAILCHVIGLTGRGYHWFFDDLLAVGGMAILACVVYMAIIIYVDLSKKAAD
jgi:hypothetical protein